MQAASQMYSWVLRNIRTALADPAEAASDQMLVAVMLLALYEVSLLTQKPEFDNNFSQTVICNSDSNMSSWNRHVDGALALMYLRGTGELNNRIGGSLLGYSSNYALKS
jgi:hypothetical protein